MPRKKFRFFQTFGWLNWIINREKRTVPHSVTHLSSSHRWRSLAASRTILTSTLTHGEKRQSNQSRLFTRPNLVTQVRKEERVKNVSRGKDIPPLSSLSLYLNNRFCHLDRTWRCSEKPNLGMYGPWTKKEMLVLVTSAQVSTSKHRTVMQNHAVQPKLRCPRWTLTSFSPHHNVKLVCRNFNA